MGLPFSVFSKIGLPGLSSPAGHVYDRYFKDMPTDTFEDFHVAYVEFCKYLNTVLPGQDFDTPPLGIIKEFYENIWKSLDEDKKKERFIGFMDEKVSKASDSDSLFIMTGLAAPAAAIVAKRSCESVPQLKKFKLQYIPNVVFVPLCTLFAIMGATALQTINKKPKPT